MSADFISPAFEIDQGVRLAERMAEPADWDDALPPATQPPAVLPPQSPDADGAGVFSDPVFTDSPVFASFSESSGLPAERMSSANEWLQTLPDLGELTSEKIAHGYDVRAFLDSFEPQDQGLLHNFLNHAASNGWSQSDVGAAIQWYLNWSADAGQAELAESHVAVDADRDIEALDKQDRDAARGTLKEIWQEEFDANIALVNRHLDSLPASQRDFYEGAELDGSLRLNNPKWLSRLAQEARSQVPPVLVEAARQHGSEKAALEHWMSDRGSPYWKGADTAALQARYRDLISSGDTGAAKPLPQGSGIGAEIAAIEHVMNTDRSRYFKDEGMQRRYRELLELRG